MFPGCVVVRGGASVAEEVDVVLSWMHMHMKTPTMLLRGRINHGMWGRGEGGIYRPEQSLLREGFHA